MNTEDEKYETFASRQDEQTSLTRFEPIEEFVSGSDFPELEKANPVSKEDKAPIKRYWLLLFVAFVLALGIDLLVFKQKSGKQFAIIVNAIMLGGIVLSLTEKRKIPWQTWILMAMVSVSSTLTVFRTEGFTSAALVIFVIIGLPLVFVTMFNGQWMVYRIREYIKNFFFLGVRKIIALPQTIVEMGKPKGDLEKNKKAWRIVGAVFLGVFIAIPLLLLFGNLLASADDQFATAMKGFLDFFAFINLPDFWPQFFIVLALFWGLVGAFYHMLSRSHRKGAVEKDEPLVPPFLPNIAALVVLGLLSLMFLVFIIMQWGYFFGGQANIQPNGFDYSTYAVRGFQDLLIVASTVAIVHYLFASITLRRSKGEKTLFSAFATLLLVQVGLILASAFKRLLMYEAAYGFTQSRLVAHVFMVFLAVLLLALIVMELTKNLKRLALVLVLLIFLFGITLTAIDVDKTVTRLNVGQEMISRPARSRLDGRYLLDKPDARPEIYRLYQSETVSDALREDLGKILACGVLRTEHFEPLGAWHTYRVPNKQQADFYAEHGKTLLEKYPPEMDDCLQGYTISGVFISCIYDCKRN